VPEQFAGFTDGEEHQFRLTVDLGLGASPDRIASCMDAIRDLVDLGDRWAIVIAREAAARALLAELMAASEPSLEPLKDVLDPADEKLAWSAVKMIHRFGNVEQSEPLFPLPPILDKYADAALPDLLRPSIRAVEVSYQNPIGLLLLGGGIVVTATVQVLQIARDWNARKRTGNAAATGAEAQARQEIARADIMEYLAAEITAGRLKVPPSELGKLLTPADLKGMSALGPEVKLELPPGLSHLVGADKK